MVPPSKSVRITRPEHNTLEHDLDGTSMNCNSLETHQRAIRCTTIAEVEADAFACFLRLLHQVTHHGCGCRQRCDSKPFTTDATILRLQS